MSYIMEGATIRNLLPEIGKEQIVHQILNGLTSPKRQISSMFFYDSLGSKLFEEITALPEYYLTRTEKTFIPQATCRLSDKLQHLEIVELGSGDCSKISLLLQGLPEEQLTTLCYKPIDVSQSAIENSTYKLIQQFPELKIDALIADFISHISQISLSNSKKLFCFFGSTLGNLDLQQSERFFDDLGNVMNREDRLLLGVDMIKERDVIERAYNDSRDVTARFNRNILNVVNSIAETNFDTEYYDHLAFYNEQYDRIEMHLKARKTQTIASPHLQDEILIRRGETIHTENSYKFNQQGVDHLTKRAGLVLEDTFSDSNQWFSLFQFIKKK
ncbi:MAG: L-histidine N(alpha)-methyltransferase [Deltaproteobacteria bacterium]|nr:L-histidine N(alpha)-methyltransferase [Deltaproteobacteria bacterium]